MNNFETKLQKALERWALGNNEDFKQLTGPTRERHYLYLRYAFFKAASGFDFSLSAIARCINRSSHATVLNGIKTYDGFCATYRDFDDKYSVVVDAMTEEIKKAFNQDIDTRLTAYICGKVSGLETEKCRGNFQVAEDALWVAGYFPLNPLKIVPPKAAWTDAMKICIRKLTRCDIVVTLADAIESKGATLELQVAQSLEIPVISINQIVNQLKTEKS